MIVNIGVLRRINEDFIGINALQIMLKRVSGLSKRLLVTDLPPKAVTTESTITTMT